MGYIIHWGMNVTAQSGGPGEWGPPDYRDRAATVRWGFDAPAQYGTRDSWVSLAFGAAAVFLVVLAPQSDVTAHWMMVSAIGITGLGYGLSALAKKWWYRVPTRAMAWFGVTLSVAATIAMASGLGR